MNKLTGLDIFKLVEKKEINIPLDELNSITNGFNRGVNYCRALMEKELEKEIIIDDEKLAVLLGEIPLKLGNLKNQYLNINGRTKIIKALASNPKKWLKIKGEDNG